MSLRSESNPLETELSNPLEFSGLVQRGVVVRMDPVTFAKRLKAARLAAGLTQDQLAQGCGISNRTVSAWETGLAEGILAENLFCVADKMNVDPRWLATGHGKIPPIPEALTEIVHDLEALTAEQQEAIRSLVHSLKR